MNARTDEQWVKAALEFSYCYEATYETNRRKRFKICSFPGRDGEDVGAGSTPAKAWADAAERIRKETR